MFSPERTIRLIAPVVCMTVIALAVPVFAESVVIGSIARSITYIDGWPQNDYRPDVNHRCFGDARIRFHDDDLLMPGISSHSTAIASLLVGSDPNVSAFWGVAPQAKLDVFEFWHFVTEYVFFQKSPGVDVLTMSLGSAFDEWWTRGIDAMAQKFGILVVAGIGNGKNAFDPPLYPAAGANVLGVGVVDSAASPNGLLRFTLPDANHSSSGPTDDGRCKPDIVAAGNWLAAVAGEEAGYELTGDYSSYSAPIVAGAAAVLIEKAKSEPYLSAAVSQKAGNCVLKSILMTSAAKLPGWHKGTADTADDNEFPLDFNQGAGMLDAEAAMALLICRQWDSNTLSPDSPNSYPVSPEPNSGFLAATLVWNRVYSDRYPFEPLAEKDVDFRLELWAADINEPNKPVLVDYSDSSVDNIEHIYYRLDEKFTGYELIVTTANGSGPDEPSRYGLSWQVR
ncbi:MAG: S8 family serine peptidase [Planctomycetes bacterium]|nr:S8 family serine peptidase [Planctomycetota bacterium]